MPPLSSTSTFAQITKCGLDFQTKNSANKCLVTIENHLNATIGHNSDANGDTAPESAIQAAYLHVPFCFHKCHYCDFYSIVDNQDRQEAFTDRLINELQAAAAAFVRHPVETVFVGGGTPTLLRPNLWERLLPAINSCLPRVNGGEFTVEANPETVTPELAAILADGGVNRVSIGCQSFNRAHLKALERWHDPLNVHRSVEIFRDTGICNINLDLIFAVPGQTLEDWMADLDQALSLQPTHLSCYGLVYEPNTPLTVKMKAGRIQPVDQDLEAAMYGATIEQLTKAGFEHYEISNWARRTGPGSVHPSHRCHHNMLYWKNANWWPFGPSAAGHVNGLRWKNVARLGEYLDHAPFAPIVDAESVDEDGRIGEAFMLGLRLIDGIPLERVDGLLSRGNRAEQRRMAIDRHVHMGLLERTDGRLRFRAAGLMLADSVLADLV